jgi:hypothetical protein
MDSQTQIALAVVAVLVIALAAWWWMRRGGGKATSGKAASFTDCSDAPLPSGYRMSKCSTGNGYLRLKRTKLGGASKPIETHTIEKATGVDQGAKKCEEYCDDNDDCTAYTYDGKARVCKLRGDAPDKLVQNSNAHNWRRSGVKLA